MTRDSRLGNPKSVGERLYVKRPRKQQQNHLITMRVSERPEHVSHAASVIPAARDHNPPRLTLSERADTLVRSRTGVGHRSICAPEDPTG